MNLEEIVLKLITYSGEARSLSMEAIQYAKNGDIEKAKAAIEESGEKSILAHREQTSLIQKEARGDKIPVSLLLIHAQDHLMTSILVKDLAQEMVEIYERMTE